MNAAMLETRLSHLSLLSLHQHHNPILPPLLITSQPLMHSCQPSRNGQDSPGILGLVPELPTIPEWAGQSRNLGPCPGDIGDAPDLHAPCTSFRRLPLAYGSSSDLKHAVSLLNCSMSVRRLPRVT